ncbi:MAG: hypothetical protein CK426_07200 [Legionella sp.]|nr:MAG: hypothetical protein CK423_04420 [Legionella sp.]PJD98009.1 MAG: hypothetical protein CK426_07200 [Legionella sp.]
MQAADYIYHANNKTCHGFLAYEENTAYKKPAVLIAHDWSGRGPLVKEKARLLAQMGYVGFAIDLYGQGQIGISVEEKKALMTPFLEDRALLRNSLQAVYDEVCLLPQVDSNNIAIIGFCFGGLCALDLARSGANIKGAVSFHGILNKPEGLEQPPVTAKILALHGYDDPMVSPQQVHSFCDEMNFLKVDWQMQMYGQVQHAFTNPEAHDKASGLMYDALAAQRSWFAMSHFLQELFAPA